jgi:hypothetical protein
MFLIEYYFEMVDYSLCYREEDYVGGDACFRPPITTRTHNLHASDIRRQKGCG